MGLPIRTWRNFEAGINMPAEVVLRFLALTGAEPRWLLTGEGSKYQSRPVGRIDSPVALANP